MPDIFLSYSRDDQEAARRVALGLEAQGFSVWWDVTLRSGEDYDQATEKALREAKAVIVLWSKQSVASRWVRTEATIALQSKTLMPVTIEPCQRPIMFELTHTTDLSHWKGDTSDKVWQTYLADVSRFINREGGQQSGHSPSHRAQGPKAAPRWVRASSDFVRKRQSWLITAAAMLLTVVATLAWVHGSAKFPQELRTDILTAPTVDPAAFALSPDGTKIVYVATDDNGTSQLWLRPLNKTTAQLLPGTDGATSPFWSPDSRSIGFIADGDLRLLDLGGGTPHTLVPAGLRGETGGAWNTDNAILFSSAPLAPLARVPATGGSVGAATTGGTEHLTETFPVFLPDQRHFLYSVLSSSSEITGIYLADLDTKDSTRLSPTNSRTAYLEGWLLWVDGGEQLLAQRLDLDQKKLVGEPVTIADRAGRHAISVSATGLVAYRSTAGRRLRQLTWFDRAGKLVGTLGEPDETQQNPAVSDKGQRVLVNRSVPGNLDVWLLDGQRLSRLTFAATPELFPVWSPDARRFAFTSTRTGSADIYVKAADGSGSEETLASSPQPKAPSDWSGDGKFLLYDSIDPQTKADIWVQPVNGDQEPWVFLKTEFEESAGQFSPDGKFVAYRSNESRRDEIYVRPFDAQGAAAKQTTGRWQISSAGGTQPRWSPDGKELYYVDPRGMLMAVPIKVTGSTIEQGRPAELFQNKSLLGTTVGAEKYMYAVDDQGRFLINTQLDDSQSTAPITLIQNWRPPGD